MYFMSIIICAFAGLGKTYLAQKYENIIDFDIGQFRYKNYGKTIEEQERQKATSHREKNEEYPNNYLSALKEVMKKDNIVFLPADLEIRDMLLKEKIKFVFIMPSVDSKEELVSRYKKRGNNEMFIKRAITDLENWSKLTYNYKKVVLPKNKYLEDYLIEKNLVQLYW